MATPVLSSTFLLTLLLAVGLFFFIRAATKDRTQVVDFKATQSSEALRQTVLAYLEERAYRPVTSTDEGQETEALEGSWLQMTGQVRPSVFLALFLGGLAAVGALCLSLVLAILFPQQGQLFLGLLAISPLASWFYWRRAGREESVAFKVTDLPEPDQATLTFKAHRDEIIQMAAQLPLVQQD